MVETVRVMPQKQSAKLNTLRATRFKESTISRVKQNRLRLKANTDATRIIQGKAHAPINFTGQLLEKMKVARPDSEKAVEVGYLVSDRSRPSNSKLSYYKIALLQHTGYRIPLTGPNGEKVRAWLSQFGIYPRKSRQFLIVSPRPFLYRAMKEYEKGTLDDKVINKFTQEIWKNL